MYFYLYDELKNEIHNFDKKLLSDFPNIVLVKNENDGKLVIENKFLNYVVKFTENDKRQLFSIIDEKAVSEYKVNIYTPFLLLNFLIDKYGKNFALKLGNSVFYIKDEKLEKVNDAFLLENNLLEHFQSENKIFSF